jgi:hypothetical protein
LTEQTSAHRFECRTLISSDCRVGENISNILELQVYHCKSGRQIHYGTAVSELDVDVEVNVKRVLDVITRVQCKARSESCESEVAAVSCRVVAAVVE